MKKLLMLTMSLTCLFLIGANSIYAACNDFSNCSYERWDKNTGTLKHFDKSGNLIGRTKGNPQQQIAQDLLAESNGMACNAAKAPGYSGKSFTTHNVRYENLDGYTFHIADYPDGSRAVTALNGEMRGYQGIALNGRQIAESWNMEVHNGYFIHYYDVAKITSYDTKQVCKYY